MYVHVSVHLYVHHMCAGALRSQKRAVDSLERELCMVGATQGECSFVRTESTLNSVITLQSYSGSFKDLICHSISKCSFLDFFFLTKAINLGVLSWWRYFNF